MEFLESLLQKLVCIPHAKLPVKLKLKNIQHFSENIISGSVTWIQRIRGER
jgi:hypothetical protein